MALEIVDSMKNEAGAYGISSAGCHCQHSGLAAFAHTDVLLRRSTRAKAPVWQHRYCSRRIAVIIVRL
jgi:hypothetical protein